MTTRNTASPRRPSEDGLLRRGGRVIGRALRSAPGPFAFGGGGAFLFAAMTVLSAVVLGWVTDEVIVPQLAAGELDGGTLALGAVAIVGVGVAKAAGVVGRRLGAYIAQFRLQARFRRDVTRRYLDLPITWHRRHTTGELLSNANADVEAAFFVAAPLPMAFAASTMLVLTAVLLVVTDPFLAAIGFSVGPAIGLANYFYQRRMRHAATVAQQARADVSEVAHESFDGALVVKTLGREQAETDRFAVSSEDLRDKMIEVGRLRAFFDPVLEALPNTGILLVLLVGAVRVRGGALSAGDLVQFAYLFQLVALPMRVFGWLLGELPRAVVGLDRVDRVLQATGDMPYGTSTGEGDLGAAVRLDGATYLHPASSREVLLNVADVRTETLDDAGHAAVTPDDDHSHERGIRDVHLEVTPGRTIAVVGPTGSGKSTIAALLVRLYDPDAGAVLFDGAPLPELDRGHLPQRVAMVFQEAFLFDDTVRENITLGDDFSDAEVERVARIAAAHDFIRELPEGYDTRVGERGATLSGGQRQRIALARALLRRPRLLVLDDATSAVDPAVEQRILADLAEAGMPSTIVVVAYRRGTIALADEVVFVDEGTVAARGSHDELMATLPAYERLIRAYEDPRGDQEVPV